MTNTYFRIYLYVLFVPKFLWAENVEYTRAQIGLQLWFIAECLDSVIYHKIIYLETYLIIASFLY